GEVQRPAQGRQVLREDPPVGDADRGEHGRRPGGGIGGPELLAVRAVGGGEVEQPADGRQLGGIAAGIAAGPGDVEDHLGPGGGPVAAEELLAGGAVAAGEVEGAADGGDVGGAEPAALGVDGGDHRGGVGAVAAGGGDPELAALAAQGRQAVV